MYTRDIEGLDALKRGEVEAFIYDEPWLAYLIRNKEAYDELEILPLRFHTQLYGMPLDSSMDESLARAISLSIIQNLETTDWELLLNEYNLLRMSNTSVFQRIAHLPSR